MHFEWQVDAEQFTSCNSSVTASAPEFRGNCIGSPDPFNLILNIEQPSAKLPSDFGFIEGGTAYLTSESLELNHQWRELTFLILKVFQVGTVLQVH